MRQLRNLLLCAALSGAALLFVPPIARAQTPVTIIPDCIIWFTLDAVETSGNLDNKNSGCVKWTVAYNSRGFTALSLQLESAPNAAGDVPGAWVAFAGTIDSGLNPNTATTQASTQATGYFPWLRVNATSVTGSGQISGVLYGFKVQSQSVTISGNVPVVGPDAVGAASTTNPVQMGLNDGSVVRRALGDTSGRTRVVGTAADGAAVAGDPVRMAGKDGSGNTQDVVTNTSGRLDRAGTSTAMADGVSNTQTLPDAEGAVSGERTFPTQFNGSTWDRDFVCTSSAPVTLTGSGNTQIIAASGSTVIRICHISLAAASALNIKITRGTGANCGTGTADVSGFYQNVTSVALDFPRGGIRGAASDAICVNLSAAVNTGGIVQYAQF